MIPIKLSLSGFLSYKEPAELDFRGFDLACIAGPNGAGKSSLLDALTWVLFGVARRKDDSLINTSSDTAAVELVFLYEGNVYRVQRSKKILKTAMLELAEEAVSEDRLMNAAFYYRAAEFYTFPDDPDKETLYDRFSELF